MTANQFIIQFKRAVQQLFIDTYKQPFDTERDIVDFYKRRDKSIKIPWDILSQRLSKSTAACYKYFINTYCKNVLEPWPADILEQTQNAVDELCRQSFPTTNFKQTKRYIIDKASEQFQLRKYTKYHFDTLYFRMYNRVERNYKEFEETHVNCKIPAPLINVYMSISNQLDFRRLHKLSICSLEVDEVVEIIKPFLDENNGLLCKE